MVPANPQSHCLLYRGSLLKHGILWAGVVIALWWAAVLLFGRSRFYGLVVILIWIVCLCLILYRNARRHERRRQSVWEANR